ncbi:SPOSA6832_00461, partial [Sporobolomyces salmonicolor]
MTTSLPSIVQLKPFLQPFPYGREGLDSWAAQYALATPSLKADVEKDGGIKPSQPYGEIWFGTHENGPAKVEGEEQSLRALVHKDPKFYLGEKLLKDGQMSSQYANDLPYLFKVLSFDKPLPLQCHPDKKLGAKVCRFSPGFPARERELTLGRSIQLKDQEKRDKGKNEDFEDSNPKPEVGVALSPFTAFVGFRPPEQLASLVKAVPEFQQLFQESTLSSFYSTASSSPSDESAKSALRSLFREAIHLDGASVKPLIKKLSARLDTEGAEKVFGAANQFTPGGEANASGESEAEAMARVWRISTKTYGEDDVGVLVSTCMMNLLRMRKGEGAWILGKPCTRRLEFLAADDLHAYVEGDIIECMANSDNMVAHGLGTEEQGGISTFVEMLSYRHLPAEKLLLQYEDGWSGGKNGLTRLYKVPIAEFDLLGTTLSPSSPSETLAPLDGPLTFVVTEGTIALKVGSEQLELSQGQAGFVRAGAEIELKSAGSERAEIWGAFYQ